MTLSTISAAAINLPTQFNATSGITLEAVVSWAMTAILVVAAIAFFFMLILGGIRWIMSGGDKANTEAARNQVTAAIIGLIIVFAGYIIVTFIQGVLGIQVFSGLQNGFGTIN